MTAVVEVKGLMQSYGEIEAVRGIDLEVEQGEIFGFLGPKMKLCRSSVRSRS